MQSSNLPFLFFYVLTIFKGCAEGRREVGEDGVIHIFNSDNQRMQFVSDN